MPQGLFFPLIVLFLFCEKSIPFAHHGPTKDCPGVSELPWLLPLREGQESFREKYWRQEKNSWWASFFPSSFPSLPSFLLPLYFLNFIRSTVYLACNEYEMLFFHFLRFRIQEQEDFKGLHAHTLLWIKQWSEKNEMRFFSDIKQVQFGRMVWQ